MNQDVDDDLGAQTERTNGPTWNSKVGRIEGQEGGKKEGSDVGMKGPWAVGI